MNNTNQTTERVANKVAGFLTVVIALATTLTGTLTAESIAYGQIQSSVLAGWLWPLSAGLAILVVFVATISGTLVGVSMINQIDEPWLFGYPEYGLLGIGGLLGTTIAVGVSLSMHITANPIAESAPGGVGESVAVLAAAVLPFAYISYDFYRPDVTLTSVSDQDDEYADLDPEEVRELTVARNPDVETPVDRQRKRSNTNKKPPNRPTKTNDDATVDEESSEPIPPRGDGSSTDLSEMEFHWVTETDVSFDDVGGMDDLKAELQRDVVKPLTTHKEKAEELGVSAANIIFHGPPGTGKTYMAQALATELELPFVQLSGADIQSKWINESAQKVRTLFKEATMVAEKEGGAVVFLDELDSVLKDRSGSANSHEEDKKVVNEFLSHLEDTEEHDVVFIGATNRLESLDEAGIRSGRIDKKVHVGKPDAEARAAILQAQLDDKPHQLSGEEIGRAAVLTTELVAADLRSLVKKAGKEVIDRDGDEIAWADLKRALNEFKDQ